jgi:plasmid stabilization system protein ParE
VVRRIRNATALLQQHAEIGRTGRLYGTRELVVSGTAYILPYRILPDRVEIISVIHGAQEWPDSL